VEGRARSRARDRVVVVVVVVVGRAGRRGCDDDGDGDVAVGDGFARRVASDVERANGIVASRDGGASSGIEIDLVSEIGWCARASERWRRGGEECVSVAAVDGARRRLRETRRGIENDGE